MNKDIIITGYCLYNLSLLSLGITQAKHISGIKGHIDYGRILLYRTVYIINGITQVSTYVNKAYYWSTDTVVYNSLYH